MIVIKDVTKFYGRSDVGLIHANAEIKTGLRSVTSNIFCTPYYFQEPYFFH